MEPDHEPIEALVQRYDEDPRAITRVSLSAALRDGKDPMKILSYLSGLGIQVASLDDIAKINSLSDEEELHAHRVAEGVAVSLASDGLWLLYTP